MTFILFIILRHIKRVVNISKPSFLFINQYKEFNLRISKLYIFVMFDSTHNSKGSCINFHHSYLLLFKKVFNMNNILRRFNFFELFSGAYLYNLYIFFEKNPITLHYYRYDRIFSILERLFNF